ncbi:10030_t:CDS:2 [Racocetra fulgida]|uniref:10030_t:CDS:1 n=1 Tax=Racocetra fulgida TaxID=60492 RepID=A0A9N9AGP1_9GLOM|nr:10030_t:CDS:2 [Racocetra fulgida]
MDPPVVEIVDPLAIEIVDFSEIEILNLDSSTVEIVDFVESVDPPVVGQTFCSWDKMNYFLTLYAKS